MGDTDDWMERAACRGFPTALFFPAEAEDDQSDGDNEIAKAICASCPVQEPCRAHQMEEPYGVRGSLTAEERGFRKRGRLDPSASIGLQGFVTDIFTVNKGAWMNTDMVNNALFADHGRRWPRNSVNAVLRRLWLRGDLERDESGDLLLYRVPKEDL